MNKYFLTTCAFIFIIGSCFAQNRRQVQIADEYYAQGEIEKARSIYKELAENPYHLQLIFENYLELLSSISAYDKAEHFLESAIKSYPSNIQFQVKLASVYKQSGQWKKFKSYLDRLKKDHLNSPFQLGIYGQYFANESMNESAINFFLESRHQRNNATIHALDLATLYRMTNNKPAMIAEYLNYASGSPNRLNYIKNLLQSFLQEEEELKVLEKTLIEKMQENPDDTQYAELLLWVELQRKNFYGAFIQARAIDKRNNRRGNRSMQIGKIALENDAYEDAMEIFQYVAKAYPTSRNYQYARNLAIKAQEKQVTSSFPVDTADVRALTKNYESLYHEFAPSQQSFAALRSKAQLHAFYLDEKKKAIALLNTLISNPRSGARLMAESKLDLGDIYLLSDQPWEATLLYSQVEKAFPNDHLSYMAKLKNARLHYYTGNFSLAKGHLDILKKNTTREISNDAINLGMLITDNTVLDSTDQVMQEFADIQLLIFQNKKTEASEKLSQMLTDHLHHSITDEVYWLKSKIEWEMGHTEASLEMLDLILASYSYDILADDAAFRKAEIVEKTLKDEQRAKDLYQQFMIDYPGSLYVAEARKRFRRLRGDFIN